MKKLLLTACFVLAIAINLIAAPLRKPTVTGAQFVCPGGSTTLTASGLTGASFQWYDAVTGGNLLASTAIYTTPHLTVSTSFYVQQTFGPGTSPRAVVYVQVVNDTFIVNSNSPVCQGSTLNLSATGGSTYSWSGPHGFSSSSSNPSVSNVNPGAIGTYYVTLTDSIGCQQLDSLKVGVNLSPTANIEPGGPITICPGNSVNLSVGPPTLPHDGPIGTKRSCDCPPGYVAVGFKDNSGGLLDQWQFACKQLNPDYTLGSTIVYTVQSAISNGGGPNGLKIFGGDTVLVGLGTQDIDGDIYFNNLFCYGLPISQVLNYANNNASHWTLDIPSRVNVYGLHQGANDSLFVPNGSVITGITILDSMWYTSTFTPDYKNLQSFFQTDSTSTRISYLWNTGDTTFSIAVQNTGNYIVTVSNSNGCSSVSPPLHVTSDSSAPKLVCPGNIINYLTGNPSSAYAYFYAYDSSYCSANVISNPPSGSVFYPGVTTVNNLAVNGVGDSASCSFTVTVIDTTPPVMSCPDTIKAPLDPTGCGARVSITPPQASDNSLPLSNTIYFGYTGGIQTWTVPPYVHSILVQAYGAGGASDNFYGSNPGYGAGVLTTLNVTPGQVIYFTVGGSSPDGITGGFNGGGNASLDVDGYNGGAGGGQTNIGTTGNPLTDTLLVAAGGGGAGIYCGNDAGGNGGGPNGLPGLSCGTPDGGGATQTAGGTGLYNGSFMQGANGDPFSPHGGGGGGGGYYGGGSGVVGGGGGGSSYVSPAFTSGTTYYEGSNGGNGYVYFTYQQSIVSVQTGGISSDSIFPFGNSTVTYTATDASGNSSSCSFTVQVVDTSAPVIHTPGNITIGEANGTCGTIVNFNVTATGRCSSTYPVVSNPPSGSIFPVGETIVTNTATGPTGNTSVSTFIITVVDSNPPVISNCPSDISVSSDLNSCGAVVSFDAPVASVLCSPIVTTYNYTGSVQQWIVPAGVESIDIQAIGAAGSPDYTYNQQGGAGAIVQTTLAVTPGEVLYITVGGYSGGQAGGYNGGGFGSYDGYGNYGGGGGGQTNIGTTGNPLTDTLVVAAGGAGSGIDCNDDYGGYGGTPMGYYGIDCGSPDGGGASQIAGGIGLNNGSYMQGGNGNANTNSSNGGGGGGGYYGGGSGNYGGGGGGSSYVTPVGTSNTAYFTGSNFFAPGQVQITYSPQVVLVQTNGLPSGSVFPLGTTGVSYTATSGAGVTSTCTFFVNVNETTGPTYATICEGSNYNFNGRILTRSGIYSDTIISGSCDSLITLDLAVTPARASSFNQTICLGQSYSFNGRNLTGDGTYYDTIQMEGGCDSIVILNLAVNVAASSAFSQTICQGQSYNFNGVELTGSGTYYDTIRMGGGCDSIVTLTLIVNPPVTSSISQSICAGDSFNFNGTFLTQNGIYNDTLTSVGGCDSIITLTLSVNPVLTTTFFDTICSGFGLTFNGSLRTTTGIYYDTLTSSTGCDSIIIFNLTVNPPLTFSFSQSICAGDTFNFNGKYLTENGNYSDTLRTLSFCDSIVTLTLTVNPVVTSSFSQSICTGSSYHFNGTDLTEAGNYNDTLSSVAGCDSIVTLNLSVLSALYTNLSDTICSGFGITFNGQLITQTGIYYDTLTSTGGCDSIISFNLTVLGLASTNLYDTICTGSSVIFNGQLRDTTGIYYNPLTSSAGCDSLVTLYLTVLPVTITNLADTICSGFGVTFNGQLRMQTGTYYDTLTSIGGCDSIIELNLTVLGLTTTNLYDTICSGSSIMFNGQLRDTTGTYLNPLISSFGCDSLVTLYLTVLPVTTTNLTDSICSGFGITFNGVLRTETGIYYDTLTSIGGCDSIIAFNLTVLGLATTNLYDTICSGSSILFNGQLLDTTGVYYNPLTSSAGCDSLVTLNLTVLPVYTTNLSDTICSGFGITFNGQLRTTSGTYYDTLTSSSGCDSIIIFSLTVNPPITSSFSQSICAGDTFNFNGKNLTEPGYYNDTLHTTSFCDSIVTLTLTVNPVLTSSFSRSICVGGSYNFNGKIETATGNYNDTLTSVTGCDSIVTLNLAVLQGSTTNIYDTICPGSSYSFNGHSLIATGVYSDTLTGIGGCDSIIILNLQVKSISSPVISASGSTYLCPGGSVTLDAGVGYSAYEWNYRSNTTETLDISQTGSYYCTVTTSGCQVSSDTVSVTVNPITVGFTTAINNASIQFTNSSANASSYLWSFGDGDTSSTPNPSHTYATAGSYSVILIVSNNSCTLADTQSVTTGCQEAQLTTGISGPVVVCAGSVQTYSTQGNSYTSQYTWILSGNCSILSGQGTNTITVQFNDNFTDDATLRVYAKGCLGYGTERSITIMKGVTPPDAIAGPVSGVCGGATQAYSVTPINGTTNYIWSVTGAQLVSGQGSDSIAVNFPQGYGSVSISLQTQTACGKSSPVTTQVTSDLSIANLNGGTSGYCAGSNGVVISIPSVTAASSYTWTMPAGVTITGGQGTDAITVNIVPSFTQDTVSVYASNICGNGPIKSFLISGKPAMPVKMIGPAFVCSDVQVTDSVKPVPFATSYTWTVPNGWVINGAATGDKIAYTPTQGNGYLTVTANNGCGSSAALTHFMGIITCGKIDDVTDSTEIINTPDNADSTNGILNRLKVFPNPFIDQFEVIFNAPAAKNIRLRLYTIQGQLLKDLYQETTSDTNQIYIDLGDEPAGVYILNAAYANETKVLRMIKQ